MMVERERERDEGEAMAVSVPRQEEEGEGEAEAAAAPAATGEKGEGDDGVRDDDDDGEERRKEESEEEEDAEEEEKKGKEELEEWSELRLAIAELSPISRRGGKLKLCSSPPTLPLLGLSHLLLRLLDKIGPTMAVLRLDVQRNIERLQELYLQDPSKYSTLTAMVEKEADDGTVRKGDSCARAILWLTRSMDFTVALLQRLEEEEGSDGQSLAQLVEAAYMVSLKPWHGWISSAACKIALKLIPERTIFMGWLMGENQNSSLLKVEIEKLVQLLQPFLDDIHAMLAKFRLDRLKST